MLQRSNVLHAFAVELKVGLIVLPDLPCDRRSSGNRAAPVARELGGYTLCPGGGLIGVGHLDIWRQATFYVDRILRVPSRAFRAHAASKR
jgi:hypothetical protein